MSKKFRVSEELPDRYYFTLVPNYIVNHSTIWERGVYLTMKRIAGEDGKCFASQQTIADNLKISRPSVSKTITKLIERGWIRETDVKRGKTKSVKEYQIVDIWKMNVDFYRQKEAVNHRTAKLSTTEQLSCKPQNTEEEHVYKKNNVISKEITDDSVVRLSPKPNKFRRNGQVDALIDSFKGKLSLKVLDGGEKENRRFAYLLLKKFGFDASQKLIEAAALNPWWAGRLTRFDMLYRNAVAIMSQATGRANADKIAYYQEK